VGSVYYLIVRVIALKRLRNFWAIHVDAEKPLRAWYIVAKKATWTTPAEVKARFATADPLPRNRVVFNIKGNAYRLVAVILYASHICYIRFVGTHKEYDDIDAT